MIRIKEAIKKAGKLVEGADELPRSTANRWSRNGVISEVEGYETTQGSGGQSGLYPDRLPIEIAIAFEFKGDIKLQTIADMREVFLHQKNHELSYDKIRENLKEMRENVFKEHYHQTPEPMQTSKDNIKAQKDMRILELARIYASKFQKYEQQII